MFSTKKIICYEDAKAGITIKIFSYQKNILLDEHQEHIHGLQKINKMYMKTHHKTGLLHNS